MSVNQRAQRSRLLKIGKFRHLVSILGLEPGFYSGFEKWASQMCCNEQFTRQHLKNKTVFFLKLKWASSQTIIMSATSYCPNTGATNRGVLQEMFVLVGK